jgi:MoaA/NifB/PqqE/SkfB family radical SAM enzyme
MIYLRDKMNEFIKIYRKASLLKKSGLFERSKSMFSGLLKKTKDNLTMSNIYYHLAQMESDVDVKKTMLRTALELNPEHRMANNLLSLLTEKNINRLKKDKIGVIRQFFEKFPLNIQIQTISKCNAKCKMCPYHSSWQKSHSGVMDEKTFLHIVNLLENIPLGKLCLYLENEPFLDKGLINKIKIVKRKLYYRLIEVSTNLSMFNKKIIEELYAELKDTPHEFWISWHGLDEETYKNIMGFDFKKNLEKLKLYFTITKGEIKTVINSIVGSRLNETKIESEEKAKEFFYNIVREVGLNPEKINLSIKTFYYHDRAGNLEEEITNDKVSRMIGKLKPNCPRIKEWLHFMYDGDIVLCCMDYQKETVMGNVNNFNSLEELLTSEQFTKYQKMALGEMDSPDDFICKRCTSPGG